MSEHIWLQASTDITIRWRKVYGYVPASEQEFYKKKWAEWKEILNAGIDDLEPPQSVKQAPCVYQLKRQK